MNREGEHLRRLAEVWLPSPVYFLTVCTANRERRLATDDFHAIAGEVWRHCERLYGWAVGHYVLMPDHVHFFATAGPAGRPLSLFVGKWKEWTAKHVARRLSWPVPLWQPEFFDHVLRSSESYTQKWEYVRQNPVRAGLTAHSDHWPYRGTLTELRFE